MKKSILINLLIMTLIIINILRITSYDYLFFNVNTTKVASNINNTTDYIGILEIPSINLKKEIVDFNSIQNNVKYNIKTIKKSDNNLILASHSGNGKNAYFKNLYKLTNGDKAYVDYNGKRYTYSIVNIYEQEKTGKIVIYRNGDKTCLTLVTCTKNSKTKQTVYILELENVENI